MQNPRTLDPRPAKLALAALVAALAALVTLAASGGHAHAATARHAGTATAPLSAKALAFHDAMRKLWEDHITWTRLAIIDLEGKAPDTKQTVARLLANQTDIGNAIKPYYGSAAGAELTALLKQHITEAAAIVGDAMAGNQEKLASDTKAWYANADAISRFLAKANPRSWPFAAVDRMMHEHLKLTTDEAVDHLKGRYAADIADYEAVHKEILMMADTLSNGIIGQFAARFS
jgi:hypothetical protein